VAFGPKGNLIATGTKDHRLRLWEAETGNLVSELFGCGQWIRDIAISRDGKYFAAVGSEDLIRVWSLKDMAAPRLVREIPGHTGGKTSKVAFAPNSRTMVTAGADGVAKRWRVGDDPYCDEFWKLRPAAWQLRELDVSSDGETVMVSLTSGTMESEIQAWNRRRREPVATHKLPWVVQGLALLPDGRTLAYAGNTAGDKRVELCNVDGTDWVRSLGEIPAPKNAYADVAIDRDATTLAVVKGDNTVWLYNLLTAAARSVELGAVENGFGDVQLSPDGRLLAAHSLGNQTIVVYDLKSEMLRATLPECTGGMAFSPGGRLLATGAANRSVLIWDVQTGRRVRQLAGHDELLRCLTFSPDGKVLATACRKKSKIKIWAVDSADELFTIRAPVNEISALAFTPDGRTLIAAGNRVKKIDGKKILMPSVAFFSAGDPTIHGETFVFRVE
jgi:WD40 repeat protein